MRFRSIGGHHFRPWFVDKVRDGRILGVDASTSTRQDEMPESLRKASIILAVLVASPPLFVPSRTADLGSARGGPCVNGPVAVARQVADALCSDG